MELPTLEVFGRIDKNFVILNSSEYAFIAGSFIIVKPLISSSERGYKYLKFKIYLTFLDPLLIFLLWTSITIKVFSLRAKVEETQ